MTSESHSTALNELPTMSNINNNNMTFQGNQNNQDNDLVNEILNEIDNQNNMDPNQSSFNRQMDNETNINQSNMPNPSTDEIQQMNNINQQNNLNNQYNDNLPQTEQQMSSDLNHIPINQGMLNMDTSLKVNNQKTQNSLFSDLKNSLLVTVLVFAILFFPKNMLLSKIPRAIDANGKISIIGNGVIALLAGIIYFILTKYVM